MSRPLIDRAVLTELREYFVGEHVLRTIEDAFTNQGITARPEAALPVTGQRRQLVESYYASLDLTRQADVQKLLRIIEREIARRPVPNEPGAAAPLSGVITALEQSRYRVEGYRIVPAATTPLVSLQGFLQKIDSPSVIEDWQRMLAAADVDPEGAITSARALVESTCKSILEELQIPYEDSWDLGKLFKTTTQALQLAPSDHKEQVFKQVLSGLFSVAAGLAEIRNALGDAHGRGKRPVRAAPRHARLAVNAAGTLTIFLLETREAKR